MLNFVDKGWKKRSVVLKGSYTVEAAVIVSVIIFVLGAFLICAFYVHDRVVLQSISCEAATAGCIFVTEEDRKSASEQISSSISAGRFLGSRDLNGNVICGKKQAVSTWHAVYPVPGFAAGYLVDNVLEISVSWTGKTIEAAEWIRKIRGAGKLLTGGMS